MSGHCDRFLRRSGTLPGTASHRPKMSRPRGLFHLSFFLLLIGNIVNQAGADTVRLRPVADTTLFETFPDNNYGHYYLVSGTTAKQGQRSRALIKFVPGATIPPGSIISSVQVTFSVNKSPRGPVSSTFDLYRMLVDWGEGTGGGGQQARGSAAKADEATWNVRFSPSTFWSAPGASAPIDFAVTPSASTPLAGSSLVFASTPELIADVQ